ncbi:MAG: helix-hairpin-helix domain-containing protein [Bacteroidia bacterium]|nr:helix-hairpin-helix domain-containing protein [Bacteroidia bacterium]MCX7764250.1 helix-hairpin-helix domain-containing protein [Bacteroidia bacterium]MDW8057437.1 Holliday junction branch migration protein RuvA [Bacteroidia bacterium]
MLYAVKGRIARVMPHQVLVESGAFILAVRVPLSASRMLSDQSEVLLYTVLQLPREEGEPVLYGFLDEAERKMFVQLLRVRSLGPQKALALLSHFPAEVLLQLIHTGNAAALTQVKGIGKKLAQQIILDMQSILRGTAMQMPSPAYEEAYEALITLGLTPQEAHSRLQAALKSEESASAERLVQLALKSS